MTSFLLILPVDFHLLEPLTLDFFTLQKLGTEDEDFPFPFNFSAGWFVSVEMYMILLQHYLVCSPSAILVCSSMQGSELGFQWKNMAIMNFNALLISLAEVDEILAIEITPLFSFCCVAFEFTFPS